jgi:hypothetical protein
MPGKPDKEAGVSKVRELKVERQVEDRQKQELYEGRPETKEEKERRLMKAEDKVTPGGIRTREP